jgi:Protein of unknown function (DUF551).
MSEDGSGPSFSTSPSRLPRLCSAVLPDLCDDEFGWSESTWVLATDGKAWQVAKYRIIPPWDDEDPSTADARWVVYGRDGYKFENVTHWMPLPPLPNVKGEAQQ